MPLRPPVLSGLPELVLLIPARAAVSALQDLLNSGAGTGPATLIVLPARELGDDWESTAETSPHSPQWITGTTVLRAGVCYFTSPGVQLRRSGNGSYVAEPLAAAEVAPGLDAVLVSAARAAGPGCLTVMIGPLEDDGETGLQALAGAGATVLMAPAGSPALTWAISVLTRSDPPFPDRSDQAFTRSLGDALSALNDPAAVTGEACRLLARHLKVDRAWCAELDDEAGTARVAGDWARGGAAPVAGTHQVGNFRRMMAMLRRGECAVIPDAQTSEFVPAQARLACAAQGMAACMIAPMIQSGTLVAAVCVAVAQPRQWSARDVALLREVSMPIWAAVERAKADVAASRSEAQLRAVSEHLPGGAMFVVDHDLKYVVAQGEALAAAGLHAEDFLGKCVTEVLPPDVVATHEASYRRALAGEGFEHEHASHGRVFLTRGVPLRTPGGAVSGVLAVSYDITDRKHAEEALQEANATLEDRVAERTRRLTDLNSELLARTRALEAFSHLTRNLSLDTDRASLIRRAQELVMTLLPEGFTAYYEPGAGIWRKVSQVGDPGNQALQTLMDTGLPLDSPSFAHPFRTGRPEYQVKYLPGTDTPATLAEHVQSTAALPVRLGNVPVGLFAVVQFTPRAWSPADRALLETVVHHLNLALDRAEAVRRLAEEREALRAFARFTELASRTSDLHFLAQQASDVLHHVLGVDCAVYLEREGETWKSRSVAGALTPAMLDLLQEGVPASIPSLAMTAARREPMFFDHWRAEGDGVPVFGPYQAVATYPLFPQDQPVGLLGAAKLHSAVWQEREQAVFRAVGDGFRLALERTAQMQQIDRQRGRLADLNSELGTFITRTAHQLELPARQLEDLFSPRAADAPPTPVFPPLDPSALSDEVTRLRAVAEDLRALSALEAHPLDTELLPLGDLMHEVQRQVSSPGRQLTWFIPSLPVVRGDRALLKQALEVVMMFTLSPTRGARFVTVSSRETEGEVRLVVDDDGVGLSGEEAATLFDLAVRTDQDVPLLDRGGLMQVRRVLARHGGWAWAEAQPTGGRVVLAFPQEQGAGEMNALFLSPPDGL